MIEERLKEVARLLPAGVRLVAVSKFHPVEQLMEAYEAGQRIFGENHAQELAAKAAVMPQDIRWHFIGHLQTNKVKQIVPFVSLIHSVDSLRLLREIDKQARRAERRIDCLLQLHVAQEETKFGFAPEELLEMLEEGEWRSLDHVRLCGIMCMATNTDDVTEIRREFQLAHQTFDEARQRFFKDDEHFCERSMGMSDDFPIAIEEGATLVRIGTRIFGQRMYH
ncbi:MAG: YggS family pyridoxal phosphate-dependent enzyme [Bacteroidaceae bacterium]|nr:YggS family pyridoxal phosphate-dependent enzyme [Bacteroidaceae bacterium]